MSIRDTRSNVITLPIALPWQEDVKEQVIATCEHHHGEPLPCSVCAGYETSKREAEKRYITNEMESRFGNIRLGKRYQNVCFDDFIPPCPEAQTILTICRAYANSFETSLKTGANIIMTGNAGTGKNLLSSSICNKIVEDGYTALHTSAMRLVRKVTDNWGALKKEPEQDIIDSFLLPDLLVIDEIGLQYGGEKEILVLTEVINRRYEEYRPTIIISNLTPAEIKQTLGFRLMERFVDIDSMTLHFTWASARGKIMQKQEVLSNQQIPNLIQRRK